jgi:hypothetical protein
MQVSEYLSSAELTSYPQSPALITAFAGAHPMRLILRTYW